MTLNNVKVGEKVKVTKLLAKGRLVSKMRLMGIVEDSIIEVIVKHGRRTPMTIRLMGYTLALRQNDASLIEVKYV